jgi:mono/diheme cytochrome c family protein
MKKILIITGCVAMTIFMVSCKDARRSEGRAYMPDMYYSRAYESYASTENLKEAGVNYNARPVSGTVARGDMPAYGIPNDSLGYIQSAAVKNPLDSSQLDMKEAQRLYMVNCAICHGSKLDGNGPLFNGGDGPYTAAPKNLMGDDMKALAEGTMFHVTTYGKGQMGSYASQLTTPERWMVVAYVKSKQSGTASVPPTATAGGAGSADSTNQAVPKQGSN